MIIVRSRWDKTQSIVPRNRKILKTYSSVILCSFKFQRYLQRDHFSDLQKKNNVG